MTAVIVAPWPTSGASEITAEAGTLTDSPEESSRMPTTMASEPRPDDWP